MAKLFERRLDEVIRLLCPLCATTWDTVHVPSECPSCGASVSVTARKLREK